MAGNESFHKQSDDVYLSKTELLNSDISASAAQTSLWQDAYDHPVRTGLGVAAVVGVGAAVLYATKGGAAERFFAGKPNVLLIEDTPGMAMAFRDALNTQGHKVTWVTGIKSLQPLTGFTPEGGEVALASKQWKLAFVDGDLGKNRLTGPEIVGTLRSKNIMSIGTSTTEDFNSAMRANGASIAANKAVIFTSVLGNKIDLKAALRAPEVAQEGLNAFGAVMRSPEHATLRKAADAKLMHYLLGK